MQKHLFLRYAGLLLSTGGMLFCSKIGDTTSLGSDVINDGSPDKTLINKHFREYSMDSTALGSGPSIPLSVPAVGDTGFGAHSVLSNGVVVTNNIFVGSQGNEQAFGFVQFMTDTSDSVLKRNISGVDSVLSVDIIFYRDSAAQACHVVVASSQKHPDWSGTDGTPLPGTMTFPPDTAHINVPDTIKLSDGQLKNDIFAACTTSSKAIARSLPASFGFILRNVDNSGLVRINGSSPAIVARYKKASDTTVYQIVRLAHDSYYYAFETDHDVSQAQRSLSYASKRTAVFQYDMKKLWQTASAGLVDTLRAEVVSAAFSTKGPDIAGDTLSVRFLLWHELVHDGARLDSLFSGDTVASIVPNTYAATLTGGATPVHVDMLQSLRGYEQGSSSIPCRPATLYLYVRYNDNSKPNWDPSRIWNNVPLLSAIVTVP